MTTEELRSVIWDQLFREKTTKSISEIAAVTACDPSAVETAVNHDWFNVTDDRVSIAMAALQSHHYQ